MTAVNSPAIMSTCSLNREQFDFFIHCTIGEGSVKLGLFPAAPLLRFEAIPPSLPTLRAPPFSDRLPNG